MERLLRRIPLYNRYLHKKLQAQSDFYRRNRVQVIDSYRFFLKQIPKIYPRPLQQFQKINEVRWIYKNSKQLPNIHETEGRTNLALQVIEDLKKGDHSRLGQFIPFFHPSQPQNMLVFLQKKLPKRYWWRGHIY